MAVTATLVPGGRVAKRWTITFALDGDVTATLDHGFNGIPDHVTLTPLNVEAYIGQVHRSSVTATQIIITKNAAGGSGGAIVEVVAYVPSSSL